MGKTASRAASGDMMKGCASTITGRSNPWIRALLFFTLVVTLLDGGARAEARGTSGTFNVFEGYLGEQIGEVRWIFPQTAEDLVDDLQEVQQAAWEKLSAELGAEIASGIEIRVAVNPEKMQKLAPPEARLPHYATGVAFASKGLILLTLTAPESWKPSPVRTVLIHELSHLALHNAVKGRSLPRWFQEGVALHQAGESSLRRTRVLWEAVVRDRLIPLQSISRSFPERYRPADLAYAQSADFVSYLLDGADNQRYFRKLIAAVRDHGDFSRAVLQSYNVSLGYLEREWRRGLKDRFGRLPLLLTGVGTVWVLTSALLLFGYIRVKRRQRATLLRWSEQEGTDREERAPPKPPDGVADSPVEEGSCPISERRVSQAKSGEGGGVPTIEYEGRNHTVH